MDIGESSMPLAALNGSAATAQEDSCLLGDNRSSTCTGSDLPDDQCIGTETGLSSPTLLPQQQQRQQMYPTPLHTYTSYTQQQQQVQAVRVGGEMHRNYGGCHHPSINPNDNDDRSTTNTTSNNNDDTTRHSSLLESIPSLTSATFSGTKYNSNGDDCHCSTLSVEVCDRDSIGRASQNSWLSFLLPSSITSSTTSSASDHRTTRSKKVTLFSNTNSLLHETTLLVLLCGVLLLTCSIFRYEMSSFSYLSSRTQTNHRPLLSHPGDTSFWSAEIWNMFWGSEAQQEADDDSTIISSSSTSKEQQDSNHNSNQPLNKNQIISPKTYNSPSRRSSSSSSSSSSSLHSSDPKLVIAGKMMVGDATCNIGEFNLRTNDWSMKERVQLSLYNSYSGGEVYYLLANHTLSKQQNKNKGINNGREGGDGNGGGVFMDNSYNYHTDSKNGMNIRNKKDTDNEDKDTDNHRGRELIVVGAFDTTDQNSQVTYCSVGAWDGTMLSKVGEGLCNSALSKGMKITTAALAGPQDVYVAGSFVTQVWNGDRHEFVKIYNIAHYDALKEVWLPLPVGQITCSWCTVTVLALAWDATRNQLHIAGKFNAIDGRNIPSGLAIYDRDSGHLVAHPGGGLTMWNRTQDGVGTALQLDEKAGVLYVMGSYERLGTGQVCFGLAAYEINENHWTCLADMSHTVRPSGGGNMLLTSYGLMVAGRITSRSTWPDHSRPYTIALLNATLRTTTDIKKNGEKSNDEENSTHNFQWSWLPGFDGHDEPLHALANGFGEHEGSVFIAGDNLVAKWSIEKRTEIVKPSNKKSGNEPLTKTVYVPVTENLSNNQVRGAIMAIAQLEPEHPPLPPGRTVIGYKLGVYLISLGALLGMFIALLCNRSLNQAIFAFIFNKEAAMKGISLDMLTYSAGKQTVNVHEAYTNAMKNRSISASIPHLLQPIDPQQIILHRIIGEGTFGRVWSAKLNSASVAVKEFVFAQAAVAGKSAQQNEIIEEIIGEAGMMAILRHPNVLQLFGCSLTAQAIWIVSELCSLGSLRQLLDDRERDLSMELRARIALQVAEGMMYLHNQDPPIIHRDLKSHNILIHETFTEASEQDPVSRSLHELSLSQNGSAPFRAEATIIAKIGDWGSARATLSGSKTMTHGVGTACWLAPEVIKHARSSRFSDVYGYGIILWELATREEVYSGLESTQIIAKVANDGLRPPIPEACPWTSLMVKCWSEKPQDRADFEEIVKTLNKIIDDLSASTVEKIRKENGDGQNGRNGDNSTSNSYQHQIIQVS